MQDHDQQSNQGVPSNFSDHDETDEQPATDVDWGDERNVDAQGIAAKRQVELRAEGVALSDANWESDEKKAKTADHIDAAVDASLDDMIDAELEREDGEAIS